MVSFFQNHSQKCDVEFLKVLLRRLELQVDSRASLIKLALSHTQ